MAKIRGHSFISINTWIKENISSGYGEFLENLRPPVAQVLADARDWDWYPSQYLVEVYEEITEKLGNIHGSIKVLEDLGSFLATQDIDFSKTPACCLPMPQILDKLPSLWSRFRDCGSLEVLSIDEEKNFAEIMLSDCTAGPMHSEVTKAWLEGVVGSMCECKIEIAGQLYPGDSYYWKVSWK